MVPGVSSTMTSTPVARSNARMLRPSFLIVGKRDGRRQNVGYDGITEAVYGGDEYFVGAVFEFFVARNLKLAHTALDVALVLLFDRFEEVGLRFFCREARDFLQFHLLGLAKLVEFGFRSRNLLVFLHQVLLFEVEVGLALVEELFFAHQTFLPLLEVGGTHFQFLRNAAFGLFCARFRLSRDFLRAFFGIELHLADLELHAPSFTQRNNKSEEVSDCYACDARKGEKQENDF